MKIVRKRHPSALLLLLLPGALCALVLAGCKTLPPPTPLDQLSARQQHGHTVYQANCARCHYDRRSGALNGPSLLSLYKRQSLPSGAAATDERVTATILHGRNMMPAMGNQVDEPDLQDLLSYLHTL